MHCMRALRTVWVHYVLYGGTTHCMGTLRRYCMSAVHTLWWYYALYEGTTYCAGHYIHGGTTHCMRALRTMRRVQRTVWRTT